jgi:hypothetical protein
MTQIEAALLRLISFMECDNVRLTKELFDLYQRLGIKEVSVEMDRVSRRYKQTVGEDDE